VKKKGEFSTTQLLMLLLAILLIFFMIAWYGGLLKDMVNIIKELFS